MLQKKLGKDEFQSISQAIQAKRNKKWKLSEEFLSWVANRT
jgi:hypothetical protein